MKINKASLLIPALRMLAGDRQWEPELVPAKEVKKPWRHVDIPKAKRKGKTFEELDVMREKIWKNDHQVCGG